MSTYDSFCFYLKNALIKRFYHSQSYSCSHRNYFLLSCRLLFWCKNRCIIDQASNYSRCGSAAWNALPCDTCSKIGANISFEAFWRNCGQLFRKNVVFFFFFLVFYHIIFKGGDFVSFMIWQVFFVVLVTTIILASNDAPESR